MYNKINELCKLHNTNITQLCIDVTGSSGNLSTWKKGYMRSDYLLKVAKILDVSVDYLLEYSPEQSAPTRKLSKLDNKLLDTFQKLSDISKGEVIGYANGLLKTEATEADLTITQRKDAV